MMEFVLLTVEDVEYLHEQVLYPGELAGSAGDKSLAGVLARVENRLAYGMISDAYELVATYAVVLVVGDVFNDENKRTAFTCMNISLTLNGIEPTFNVMEAADLIIEAAQGRVDEAALAEWLRQTAT
jgi:death-on-curing protein